MVGAEEWGEGADEESSLSRPASSRPENPGRWSLQGPNATGDVTTTPSSRV